jgi:tRNA 2-thiouridine synthesizing protein A
MDTPTSESESAPQVYDTGDRSCGGELIQEIDAFAEPLAPGSVVLVVNADPAAPLDLRAWAVRRGYTYLGQRDYDGRPAYAIRKGGAPAGTIQG